VSLAANAMRRTLKPKKQFTDLGGTALAGSPADLGMLLAGETEKWQGREILRCQAGLSNGGWEFHDIPTTGGNVEQRG